VSKNTTPAKVLVRTSEENKEWLKQAAEAQERSVNWMAHKIITDARLAAQAAGNVSQ
jgi:predicted HicB family RNase H-like nuclease